MVCKLNFLSSPGPSPFKMAGSAPAFWIPFPEQQKQWKSLSIVVDVKKNVQESAHATRAALCAQPDASVQENVTSS